MKQVEITLNVNGRARAGDCSAPHDAGRLPSGRTPSDRYPCRM